MDPEDPPRKVYGFKERDFVRDNPPASAQSANPTAKELAIMAGAATPTAPTPARPRANDPNDVYTILQHNRAKAQQHGLNEVEIKRTRSKRKRDYWLLLVPSDLLLGILIWQARSNPVVMVYGLAGLVVLTLGITWIMWFVMDDY